jgi:hypothetical protein
MTGKEKKTLPACKKWAVTGRKRCSYTSPM